MYFRIAIIGAAFATQAVAEHPLIDRLEKDIDYLDAKTAESDALDHHQLGVILKEFERNEKPVFDAVGNVAQKN